MPLPGFDGFTGCSFGLEIDGVTLKGISEVSGLRMEHDVIEVEQSTPDGRFVLKKLPGRWKAGECTLTRPVSSDVGFQDLIQKSHSSPADGARKGGAIIVFDAEGQEVKRYAVTDAWPKSVEIGTLEAGDTNVLTEKLVLAYETLEIG
jgi:phage tail-like protein